MDLVLCGNERGIGRRFEIRDEEAGRHRIAGRLMCEIAQALVSES